MNNIEKKALEEVVVSVMMMNIIMIEIKRVMVVIKEDPIGLRKVVVVATKVVDKVVVIMMIITNKIIKTEIMIIDLLNKSNTDKKGNNKKIDHNIRTIEIIKDKANHTEKIEEQEEDKEVAIEVIVMDIEVIVVDIEVKKVVVVELMYRRNMSKKEVSLPRMRLKKESL